MTALPGTGCAVCEHTRCERCGDIACAAHVVDVGTFAGSRDAPPETESWCLACAAEGIHDPVPPVPVSVLVDAARAAFRRQCAAAGRECDAAVIAAWNNSICELALEISSARGEL